MKNRRALTFAIGLGIFSFILLFIYVSNIEKTFLGKYELIPVVVAKVDIRQFETLDEKMVEIQQIPRPYVQPMVLTAENIQDLIGQTAAVSIRKGEQILQTKLSAMGEEGISHVIADGSRACTIAVTEVTGVGGHIRNGDHIDIIGTFKTLNDKRVVKDLQAVTLFQNINVLATGRNYLYDRPTPTSKSSRDSLFPTVSQSSGFSTVTLEVSPRTCMDLTIAQETGTLTLSLRSYNDRYSGNIIDNLKTVRSNTESVTGIKEPVQVKETPQWLEQRGEQTSVVP